VNRDGLSERDICNGFVTPAVIDADWDLQAHIRQEATFIAGRIIVRNKTCRSPCTHSVLSAGYSFSGCGQ